MGHVTRVNISSSISNAKNGGSFSGKQMHWAENLCSAFAVCSARSILAANVLVLIVAPQELGESLALSVRSNLDIRSSKSATSMALSITFAT